LIPSAQRLINALLIVPDDRVVTFKGAAADEVHHLRERLG
jgi:hypothetical protein